MIQLEQIQELDRKIQAALTLVGRLRNENSELKQSLDGYQKRIGELESLVDAFKADQGAIEQGILKALKELDALEDVVAGSGSAPEAPAAESSKASTATIEAPEADTPPLQSESPVDTPKDTDVAPTPQTEEDAEEEEAPDTGESELDIF